MIYIVVKDSKKSKTKQKNCQFFTKNNEEGALGRAKTVPA